jgi:hypothetical protein
MFGNTLLIGSATSSEFPHVATYLDRFIQRSSVPGLNKNLSQIA